jgi:hypothetical protein
MEKAVRKIACTFLLVLVTTAGILRIAYAERDFLEDFNDTYGTAGTRLDSCITCHSTINLNPYGDDFQDNGFSFDAVDPMDSDDDGFSNITEINARTFPGDPADVPGDTDGGCFIATAAYASPIHPALTLGPEATLVLVLLFGTSLMALAGFRHLPFIFRPSYAAMTGKN